MLPTSECQHCLESVQWSDGAFRHLANGSTECAPTEPAQTCECGEPANGGRGFDALLAHVAQRQEEWYGG